MIKDNIKLSIFWVFSFLVIIFMMAFTSHAADAQDYFPMYQNGNNLFSETLKNALARDLDPENNFIIVKYGYVDGPFTNFFYISIPKDSTTKLYAEKYNNLTQFSVYYTGNGSVRCYQINYLSDGTRGGVFESSLSEFQGCFSSNYSSSVSYISNFQLYTNNTSTRQIVLLYDDGVTVPEGDTARDDMEIPDIADYIPDWTNPPSFDNSSVESALESVYDGILWLGVNIKDTISGIGKFIGDVVRWGLQRVIDTIRDKINDIKNSINEKLTAIQGFISDVKGYVYEIKQYIDYIKEPLDQDIIYDNISTTSLVSNVNTIKTSLTSFQSSFTGVAEPTSYTIPIHLENLPSNWFGNQTTQYIDLGVINSTVKEGLRLFVWAMVTYGLVVTIFDSISNYINGGGDES